MKAIAIPALGRIKHQLMLNRDEDDRSRSTTDPTRPAFPGHST